MSSSLPPHRTSGTESPEARSSRGSFLVEAIGSLIVASFWALVFWYMSGYSVTPVDPFRTWNPITVLAILVILGFALPVLILVGLWARWREQALGHISAIGWGVIIGGYTFIFICPFIAHMVRR
jgi:hypothetical protein